MPQKRRARCCLDKKNKPKKATKCGQKTTVKLSTSQEKKVQGGKRRPPKEGDRRLEKRGLYQKPTEIPAHSTNSKRLFRASKKYFFDMYLPFMPKGSPRDITQQALDASLRKFTESMFPGLLAMLSQEEE